MKKILFLFLLINLSCTESIKKKNPPLSSSQNWITIEGTDIKFTKSPLGQHPYSKSISICNELKIEGKDNWELPNKEDLIRIYNYIKSKRISGFGERDYWSNSYSGVYNGQECYYRISFVDGTSNKYGYSNNEGYMVICISKD